MFTDHVGLKVRDLDSSVKFYCENLEFEVESKYENEMSNIVFIKNENTVIELICPKNGEYGQVPNGIISHLAFTVKDMAYYIDKLKKNNVSFVTDEPKKMESKQIIFFTGPDEERLEFVQYL